MSAVEDYQKVQRALAKLLAWAPREQSFIPLSTRAKIAVTVDNNLTAHAIRCAPLPYNNEASLNTLEYCAVIDDENPVKWQTISKQIYNPAFPIISIERERVVIAGAGALKNHQEALKLHSYQALIFAKSSGSADFIGTGIERLNSAFRMAISSDGAIYLITTKWSPPPVSPSARPLILSMLQNGESNIIANPIKGTDTAGNFPTDAAIYLTADRKIHIVYDGLFAGDQPGPAHIVHLILDDRGKIVAVNNLGDAPKDLILTRIFADQKGRLFCLMVSCKTDSQTDFEHKIVPLNNVDQSGDRASIIFIDHWLRAHMIWFEDDECRYLGPEAIPQ